MLTAQTEPSSDTTLSNQNQSQPKSKFDSVIVFGQGPIKPVLLPDEVTPEQLKAWQTYKEDPFRHKEPNFHLIQQPKYLQQIERIKQEEKITSEEKQKLIELKRQEWQRIGWLAMKTMGRQNALAAGYALYKGLTKKVIFTGGRTLSPWAKEVLPKERLAAWPSEAELMKDIVLSHYGDLYEKKFGTMINDVVFVEDAATNTLENISFVLNKYPELLEKEMRIGYLSARHHLRRIKLLANVFSLKCEDEYQLLAAQELVQESQKAVVEAQEKQTVQVDEQNYLDAKVQCDHEERWRRGLREPEYVTYWLGFLADVRYPFLIQKTFTRLCDSLWREYTKKALAQVGIDFDDYRENNLAEMARTNPEKYKAFITSLRKLKSPEYRKFPTVSAPAYK